jgi:hypothetical protein
VVSPAVARSEIVQFRLSLELPKIKMDLLERSTPVRRSQDFCFAFGNSPVVKTSLTNSTTSRVLGVTGFMYTSDI